ncbi:MAG: cyclic nucleotide-binding domain-containing protein, partial [Deltaproteobacteria bacterium]|nr:cyclic nucleotide-binding domain-containing protein [Deltaproteobacteria bacterium]
ESRNREDLLLAVTTAARTGEAKLADGLYAILEKEEDPVVRARTIEALGALDIPGRNDRIIPWLRSPSPAVRRAVLEALALDDEEALGQAIEMLGDESPDVRKTALKRIEETGKRAVPLLLKSLPSPRRVLKDGVLTLLERLEVKDLEFSEVITREIRQAYENIRTIESLKALEQTPALALLVKHLQDRNEDAVFTVFRILEVQGGGTQMRTVYRGLKAGARDRANALETLETTLNPVLTHILIPLIEDIPAQEKLKIAGKQFGLDGATRSDPASVLGDLLVSNDPITQICALSVIGEARMAGFSDKLESLRNHPDLMVRQTAGQALDRIKGTDRGTEGKTSLSTTDKMIHLKGAYIFSDLQVRELAAISSATTQKDCSAGDVVVREGDPGDNMFLIISGQFSVIQKDGTDQGLVINTIGSGDYFGEMALFEDKPRANTVKADTDSKLLVLGKSQFEDIMRHFPQIPINICRVFSRRIRESEEKFSSGGETVA